MSTAKLLEVYQGISNWGRWGPEDERGALNLVTAEVRRRAAASVRSGTTASLGLPIRSTGEAGRNPVSHMLIGGDAAAPEGFSQAQDYFGLVPHGPMYTHLDALCHIFLNGRMYNDRPAALVQSTGARANDITAAAGTVTRGVLLDIPPVRGVPYLHPDAPVMPEELDEAERAAGVEVLPGDAVLIRLGRQVREAVEPGSGMKDGGMWMAGLHPSCLRWLRDRDVSILGSDGGSDVIPTPHAMNMPIHVGALVYLGVHLIDNAALDGLSAACTAESSWSFLFSLGALSIPGSTASPVNPVAVL